MGTNYDPGATGASQSWILPGRALARFVARARRQKTGFRRLELGSVWYTFFEAN